MLRLISGREHTVYTGYCVREARAAAGARRGRRTRRSTFSRVVARRCGFRRLSDAQTGVTSRAASARQAGAYAAKGLGMALVESVRGLYERGGPAHRQLLADLEAHFGLALYGGSFHIASSHQVALTGSVQHRGLGD